MNRRNFMRNILVAGASFAVLPPANTYDRIWKVKRHGFWHPLNQYGLAFDSHLSPGIVEFEWLKALVNAPVIKWEHDIGIAVV